MKNVQDEPECIVQDLRMNMNQPSWASLIVFLTTKSSSRYRFTMIFFQALIFQDGNLLSGSLEALIQHLVPTGDYYPDVSIFAIATFSLDIDTCIYHAWYYRSITEPSVNFTIDNATFEISKVLFQYSVSFRLDSSFGSSCITRPKTHVVTRVNEINTCWFPLLK